MFGSLAQSAQTPAPHADAGFLAEAYLARSSAEWTVLKPNPLEALRNFEPAANEEYRLGKGDEITVDFAGRPDLQAKLVVGPDGRITLPLAGDIMLDGLTRPESGQSHCGGAGDYYDNLAVQVTVTKYTANRVLVLGAVATPGEVTFEGTPTLLEALTRSGLSTGPNKAGARFPSAAPFIAAATRWCGCSCENWSSRAIRWPICACAATT